MQPTTRPPSATQHFFVQCVVPGFISMRELFRQLIREPRPLPCESSSAFFFGLFRLYFGTRTLPLDQKSACRTTTDRNFCKTSIYRRKKSVQADLIAYAHGQRGSQQSGPTMGHTISSRNSTGFHAVCSWKKVHLNHRMMSCSFFQPFGSFVRRRRVQVMGRTGREIEW